MHVKNSYFRLITLRSLLLVGALFALKGAAECRALTVYNIAINTGTWTGQQGILAFDLIGGDSIFANNTASIAGFSTDGTLTPGGSVFLTDSGFFNEELKDITFGSFLNFSLLLTEDHAGPGFDQFSFFLLDPTTFLPLFETNDPTGANALFAIDISAAGGGVPYVFESVAAGTSWQLLPPTGPAVADGGSTFALLGLTLGVVAGLGRMRRRRS